MSATIGIDLGTTNSCVARAKGFDAEVIANYQGYRTTPSIVAKNPSGKILVGHLAKRQAVTNAGNTLYAAKRLIGRRFASKEVAKMRERAPFEIVEGENNDARLKLGDEILSPSQVGALLLTEIKNFASEALGEPVTKAIITVPAYFNDNQRQATKDAGRIAGLEVERIINEPTAACMAYGLGRGRSETVVVFDYGGGTFDISVITINKNVFEVLATSGDSFLGGEDIDDELVSYLLDYGKKTYDVDLGENPLALQRIKLSAEEVKKNLSFQPKEQVVLPFLAQGPDGKPLNFECEIDRPTLENLALPHVERALKICAQTLKMCNLKHSEIDGVLLVGGQTRMPLIQEKVTEFFGQSPRKGINPDEVVAVGAAIDAAMLEEDSADVLLMDVTPLNLGIATQGDIFSTLIERNSRVPIKRGHVFTTVQDNQDTVKVSVYQGSEERASDNELLGEFSLTGIRPALRGEPRIEVTFSISSDGLVSVSAKDLDTGHEQGIEVSSANKLTDDQIDSMAAANDEYAIELRD